MQRESVAENEEGRKLLSGDAPTTIIDEQLNNQDATNDFPEDETDPETTADDGVHEKAKIQTSPTNNDAQTTSGDLLLKGNPPANDLVSFFRIIL